MTVAEALERMRTYPGGSYMRCPFCGCKSQTHEQDCPIEIVAAAVPEWQSIETAPKDGTEVIGYRKDAGVFLIRWTSPESFCTDEELGALGDSGYVESWWYADFVAGGRLEGSEVPTHWMPMLNGPKCVRP